MKLDLQVHTWSDFLSHELCIILVQVALCLVSLSKLSFNHGAEYSPGSLLAEPSVFFAGFSPRDYFNMFHMYLAGQLDRWPLR